jgi:glycolate dehydrogenase iron-sulfur subunit
MQTNFSLKQLADPNVAESEQILRKCVHCGFCTATCPTYINLGDELDSPRGRIYLIKNFLESDAPPSPSLVTHVDRCLSCLSCMTTCPSGVNYMHLVDHARAEIEAKHVRPVGDRLLRRLLAMVLPRPSLFRFSLIAAKFGRPFAGLMPGRLKGMITMAPDQLPAKDILSGQQIFKARGERSKRVALLAGCAQQVLAPSINRATIDFLTRHGAEVVVADGAGCCGALTHHMGREADAHAAAKANISAWHRELEGEGLDAIIVNASGCGTTVKDYGFMLRNDDNWAAKAEHISSLSKDISEFAVELKTEFRLNETTAGLKVAYHAACSLQHGQQIKDAPMELLRDAGFDVSPIPEGHLCCGSAGTYNLMQPEMADKLLDRKLGNIAKITPDVIAAGNIGCIEQIGKGSTPIVHSIELLNWASGGNKPDTLR